MSNYALATNVTIKEMVNGKKRLSEISNNIYKLQSEFHDIVSRITNNPWLKYDSTEKEVDSALWEYIIKNLKILDVMSTKRRGEYLEDNKVNPMEFTLENITNIINNANQIYGKEIETFIKETYNSFINCYYEVVFEKMMQESERKDGATIEYTYPSFGTMSFTPKKTED